MSTEVLIMMRSGREYRLVVSDEDYAALIAHKDIGANRVFTITKDSSKPVQEIPWHKLFPGMKLYRLKSEVPAKPRTYVRRDKSRVMFASEPVGPIEWYSGDLRTPFYSFHM